jgi:hypothetical protein
MATKTTDIAEKGQRAGSEIVEPGRKVVRGKNPAVEREDPEAGTGNASDDHEVEIEEKGTGEFHGKNFVTFIGIFVRMLKCPKLHRSREPLKSDSSTKPSSSSTLAEHKKPRRQKCHHHLRHHHCIKHRHRCPTKALKKRYFKRKDNNFFSLTFRLDEPMEMDANGKSAQKSVVIISSK